MTTHPIPRLVVEHSVDGVRGVGGVVWKLPHGDDPDGQLDGNLVRMAAGRSIGEHVNAEVDVLLVMRGGSGDLIVDGASHPLTSTTVALVPRGTRRSIVAGDDGITYLGVHVRRQGLHITQHDGE